MLFEYNVTSTETRKSGERDGLSATRLGVAVAKWHVYVFEV